MLGVHREEEEEEEGLLGGVWGVVVWKQKTMCVSFFLSFLPDEG
jgi:hypothetical protein